jgi:hypothetical protein
VADKYIEYELILVIIDIVRHRVQAYRHLLFNREPICLAKWSFVRNLCLAVIAVNLLLRIGVLRCLEIPNPDDRDLTFDILYILARTALLSMLEHALIVLPVLLMAIVRYQQLPLWQSLQSHRMRTVYLALALPELGKILAILLETWDKEPALMVLIGLLVSSVQVLALYAATGDRTIWPAAAIITGIALQVALRSSIYTHDQVLALGYII